MSSRQPRSLPEAAGRVINSGQKCSRGQVPCVLWQQPPPGAKPPLRQQRHLGPEGVDAPLRVTTGADVAYYELDTTGDVRRLRGSGGTDLGGYRYSAFGVLYPADAGTPAPTVDQPLRWKGRPFLEVAGGVYDMRARWWRQAGESRAWRMLYPGGVW